MNTCRERFCRGPSIRLLLLSLLALNVTGCAYIGAAIALSVGGGSSSTTKANLEPSVSFVGTPVPQAADLVATIDYLLSDPNGDAIDITVDFSTDNGTTWTAATEGPGSDGTQGVASSSAGTPHVYAWDFFTDLFGSDVMLLQTVTFDVTLRFTSDDGVTRMTPLPQDTVSVRVGNFPPIVSINSITSTPADSSAEIRYTVIDDFSDLLDLVIEYSVDDFATAGLVATQLVPPSLGCPDGVTGLSSSLAGDLHCFEWDFPTDLLTAADGMKVRLVVTDTALASSLPAVSSPFRVGNDAPILLMGAADTQFGVGIDFTLLDSTSDTVDIFVEYSIDDGVNYSPALSVVGSTAGLLASDQGTFHNLAWNALADIGLGTFSMVRVRITPTDQFGAMGASATTDTLDLTNTDLPFAFITSPRTNDVVGGAVAMDYLLVDFDSDSMVSILVEYRAAGSPTFVAASEGIGGNGITNLTSSPTGTAHTYIWDTSIDIPALDVSDAEIRITPTDTTGPGTAAIGGPYRVDNNVEPTIQNISTPVSPATQDISITYDIVDPEGDLVDILVQFSTDGGITFPDHAHQPASGSDGIRGLSSSPGGTSHVFAWDSVRDLGPVTVSLVMVRIIPTDNLDPDLGQGAPDMTGTFTVDNFPTTAPPTIDSLSPNQGDPAGMNPLLISGSGYLPGTTAMIGALPLANLTIVGEDTLTGVVPAYPGGPTVVDVTVDNGNGTATLVAGYRYRYVIEGRLDTTFDSKGWVIHNSAAGGDSQDSARAVAVEPSGRILMAGLSRNAAFNSDLVIWAYNPDGTLDTTFGSGGGPPGIAVHDNAGGGNGTDEGKSIVVEPSGRILVGGLSFNATFDFDMVVWAFNSNGTLDTTFNGQGWLVHDSAAGGVNGNDRAEDITLDPAGQIVVTGRSRTPLTDDAMVIWKFNPDGSFDTTFNLQGWVVHDNAAGGTGFDEGKGIIVESSGRILVSGNSRNASGIADMVVWAFMPDGSLDPGFNGLGFFVHDNAAGGMGPDDGYSITLDSTGRILVAGYSQSLSTGKDMTIWALNSNGTLDTSFNGQGWVVHGSAAGGMGDDIGRGVTVDAFDRIVVTGESEKPAGFGAADMVIWRYDSMGSLDPTFGGSGFITHDVTCGVTVTNVGVGVTLDAAGRILVAGFGPGNTGDDMVLWRYNPDGTMDPSLQPGGWAIYGNAAGGASTDVGNDVVQDASGRILVTGLSRNLLFDLDMVIWAMNPDGTLDTTFNGQGWIFHDNAAGGGAEDRGNAIAIDAAGRIIVAGQSDGNLQDLAVWAYDATGTLDPAFGTGGIFIHDNAAGGNGGDIGRDMIIESSGRILISGNSSALTGDDMVIWALNSNGTFDTSFNGQGWVTHDNAAGGFNADQGRGITVDGSGRILVTGSSLNGQLDQDMVVWAFLPGGILDTTFNFQGWVVHANAAGGMGNDYGNDVAVDLGGRIMVAGASVGANGFDLTVWAFLPDGSLDRTYNGQGWISLDNLAGGSARDLGQGLLVDFNNRVVVSGVSRSVTDDDMLVMRFTEGGSRDMTFGSQGLLLHDGPGDGIVESADGIALDSFGRILTTGLGSNSFGTNLMVTWRIQ